MIKKLIDSFLKKKKVFIIYRMGSAIGDQLLLTGVANLIKKKYNYKVVIFTSYKELFYNNQNIFRIFSFRRSSIICRIIFKFFEYFSFDFIKNYSSRIEDTNKMFGLKKYQKIHLAEYHAMGLNLDLDFKNYKPDIFFSENELNNFKKKFVLPKNYAIIQATGKESFTRNKEWGFENFQKVVDGSKNINWVQLCEKKDKKLNNTYNVFDNINLRELFYLVYQSKFILCLEGLYNHVAAAFKKKTFLILSGFISENHVKYKNNVIIQKYQSLICAPCYKLYDCDIENKPCTNNISTDDVIKLLNSE